MTVQGFASRDDAADYLRSQGWARGFSGTWFHPKLPALVAETGSNAFGFRSFVEITERKPVRMVS